MIYLLFAYYDFESVLPSDACIEVSADLEALKTKAMTVKDGKYTYDNVEIFVIEKDKLVLVWKQK